MWREGVEQAPEGGEGRVRVDRLGGELAVLNGGHRQILADADAAETQAFQPLRFVPFADDHLGAAAPYVDHQSRTGCAIDIVRDTEVDQACFLHPGDDFDRMAEGLFGGGEKCVGILSPAQSARADYAHLMRLHVPQTLAEALAMVLEGFEAYIATGFEADGGSIEGVGYWAYGLMYYTIVAELLREITGGELDLLAAERMKAIAAYPVGMALKPPLYLNFGDTPDTVALPAGIVQRISERTGVRELRALVGSSTMPDEHSYSVAKLPVMLRQLVWWDGKDDELPPLHDYVLPTVGVIKLAGCAGEKPVAFGVTVGHTDGHHSHVDVGSFVYHIDGESLIADAGRGKYSKAYFRQTRYDNPFNNASLHNIPRIGGQIWIFFVLLHMAITGTAIPLVRYINVRFTPIRAPLPPGGIIVRQSVWIGLYLVVCAWMQIPRVLTPIVALLLALVLLMTFPQIALWLPELLYR